MTVKTVSLRNDKFLVKKEISGPSLIKEDPDPSFLKVNLVFFFF
jgi:hypothetical protein